MQTTQDRRGPSTSRMADSAMVYGWISIALHWTTAIVVVALLITGSSFALSQQPERMARYVGLHASIAVSGYLLLWLRIVWRLRLKHPRAPGQQYSWSFRFASIVHYLILVAMVVMLISGPLLAWAQGRSIGVLGFSIPAPFGAHAWLALILRQVHGAGATVICYGILFHIAGVLKHVIYDRDGTFSRMMVPEQPLCEAALQVSIPSVELRSQRQEDEVAAREGVRR